MEQNKPRVLEFLGSAFKEFTNTNLELFDKLRFHMQSLENYFRDVLLVIFALQIKKQHLFLISYFSISYHQIVLEFSAFLRHVSFIQIDLNRFEIKKKESQTLYQDYRVKLWQIVKNCVLQNKRCILSILLPSNRNNPTLNHAVFLIMQNIEQIIENNDPFETFDKDELSSLIKILKYDDKKKDFQQHGIINEIQEQIMKNLKFVLCVKEE